MIGWLKRIFRRSQKTAPPRLATHRASETRAAPFAFNFSVSGPDTMPGRFRSPALAPLWQKVGGISHPQHPFLDPSCSPVSLMPAVDFSPWVTERLGAGDWESV